MHESSFTPEQLATIKNQVDPLLVPLSLWMTHIENNTRIQFDRYLPTPPNIRVGEFVLTEKDWFGEVVKGLRDLYREEKLIDRLWFITKLEPKQVMPKADIFDRGSRQPGSFRSKS